MHGVKLRISFGREQAFVLNLPGDCQCDIW